MSHLVKLACVVLLCPIGIVGIRASDQTPAKEPPSKAARRSDKPAVRPVPTPASIIGWEPGDDYKMVDAAQISTYFRALDAASDRISVIEIGKSVQGRPLELAIISSETNMARLARFKEISHKLAMARDLSEGEARQFAKEGKAVIWINHGDHATEPAQPDSAVRLGYHLVASDDEDVRLIRENAIVLLAPMMNPDGRERMLGWYKKNLGTEFETTPLPYLDHPYFGHENNRDAFMLVTPEIQALGKMLWQEWNPQIVVDHHQGAPFPSRIFIPPLGEPLNPEIPALTARGINLVGAAMGMRFDQEGKPGAISRATYTAWWNGSVDGSVTFHNQVGVLVEVQQRPAWFASPGFTAPDALPKTFAMRSAPAAITPDSPSVFYTNPWKGGSWKFRDQVDYFTTASMGAAAIAARLKDEWLFNIYQVARENIEKGRSGRPYAYVIPAEQWDSSEAIELVNVLQRGGLEVHRALAPFTAGTKSYPAGTFVAFAAQAFRAQLVSLMEPQRHPTMYQFPGGPPIPPYDQSAWTVPMIMGVQADRVDAPFEVQAEILTGAVVRRGEVSGQGPGFALSTNENASFRTVNHLWGAGLPVTRATAAFEGAGRRWPAGTFVVRADRPRLEAIAAATGARFTGIGGVTLQDARVSRPTIGLYQGYVVSTHNPDEGWTRWIFERYGFEYETLKDADIRQRDLSKYTAIILPDQEHGDSYLLGFTPGTMPPEYCGGIGSDGAANLRRYVEKGGTLIALDHASMFVVEQLGLPIRNAASSLAAEQLFIPGSFIRTVFDNGQPIAYGMQPEGAVMYYRRGALDHMVFEIVKPAAAGDKRASRDVAVAGRFADRNLLMSGWELGAERYLAGTPAVLQVPFGAGGAVLINFRPQFRDQARGTFKILFNAMLASSTEKARTPGTRP